MTTFTVAAVELAVKISLGEWDDLHHLADKVLEAAEAEGITDDAGQVVR